MQPKPALKPSRKPAEDETRSYMQAVDTVSDEFEKAERLMLDAILNAKHDG